jgi:hypothetical protein
VTAAPRLERTTFETSRLLEYFTERELRYQTGRQPAEWPLVILKECIDNALDACEDAGIAPVITVRLFETGAGAHITVSDNGAGMPLEVVERILDYSVRVSDKEAYVSPTRGAQGNALKTIIAIPYVLSLLAKESRPAGHVSIESRGVCHALTVATDLLRQAPRIDHEQRRGGAELGTSVGVALNYTCLPVTSYAATSYKWVRNYALFNPHASFQLVCNGDEYNFNAGLPAFEKWTPSDPTSPHWYDADDLGRLIGSHIVHAEQGGHDLTLREFVSQFRGLSSTAKQKQVTAAFCQKRLSDFLEDGHLDGAGIGRLLESLRGESRPVKPALLGVLGEEWLRSALAEGHGFIGEDCRYFAAKDEEGGLPYVLELALARKEEGRLEVCHGLNFAPTYGDPFSEVQLQTATKKATFAGTGLGSLLSEFKIQQSDPLVFVVHLAFPRLRFRDRGKTGLQLGGVS